MTFSCFYISYGRKCEWNLCWVVGHTVLECCEWNLCMMYHKSSSCWKKMRDCYLSTIFWLLNFFIFVSPLLFVQLLMFLQFGGYTLVRNSKDLFESFGFEDQPIIIGLIIFQVCYKHIFNKHLFYSFTNFLLPTTKCGLTRQICSEWI